VAEAPRPSHGLIDTSVVIALENIDAGQLPSKLPISAPTMAEFAAGGPHATGDAGKRARRQDPLQRAEAQFSEATRAKLRNRLRLLMRKLKLIDDEFGT
jgi:hypothetical protein